MLLIVDKYQDKAFVERFVGLAGTVHMEDAAIKMFKGTFKGSDAHETELLQEIAILERAKTKYVTRFLGYSVCREGIILCMEFCEGGTAFPSAAPTT